MRKMLYALLLFLLSACQTPGPSEEVSLRVYHEIDSLLQVNDYFIARDKYQIACDSLQEFHRLKLGAVIDNVFNRLSASNRKIDSLFKFYDAKLSDKDKYRLLRTRQMNHSKLFEYKEADEAMDEMLTSNKSQIKEEDVEDYENTKKIWAALAGEPPQQVIIYEHTVLKLKRDKLGLQNLELKLDSLVMDFIFDTGANFSTVTESTAQKLKIRIMDTTVIDVGSITGNKVKSKIGVCPEFSLGDILVKNAVFLVMPDEALAIPQIPFQINGIIGFPVIEAMKEVQLTRSGEFIVPSQRSAHREQNMALSFLTPVIRLDEGNFTFDSGANSTMLYDNYFKKHKDSIVANYPETDIRFGGAGGHTTIRGYRVPFSTTISNRVIQLDSVELLKESLKEDNHFTGNFGQDLIGQFEKMTLNFESMFIWFE